MAFTFTKELVQHTPHLHFQHSQDGATLRATELKPKLDAFLNDKHGEIPDRFRVATDEGEEKNALDYKLRISGKKDREYIVGSFISRRDKERLDGEGLEYLSNTPYFADNPHIKNGAWDEARRALTYTHLEVEVFSFHEELVGWVEEALPRVLAYENFGTRQSKGFGSFTTADTTIEDFEGYLKERIEKSNTPRILWQSLGTRDAGRIFKFIDEEYKILKSGNQSYRSQMMLYYEDEHKITWEKPPIKRHLVKSRNSGRQDLQKDDKTKYIRAFLGVAELYEFPQMRTKVNVECFDKNDIRKSLVERFRSPITFKVFQDRVYLLTHPIPPALFGCTFRFHNEKGEILIKTPSAEVGFDLDDFLYNYTEKEDWNHVNKPK